MRDAILISIQILTLRQYWTNYLSQRIHDGTLRFYAMGYLTTPRYTIGRYYYGRFTTAIVRSTSKASIIPHIPKLIHLSIGLIGQFDGTGFTALLYGIPCDIIVYQNVIRNFNGDRTAPE